MAMGDGLLDGVPPIGRPEGLWDAALLDIGDGVLVIGDGLIIKPRLRSFAWKWDGVPPIGRPEGLWDAALLVIGDGVLAIGDGVLAMGEQMNELTMATPLWSAAACRRRIISPSIVSASSG